MARDSRTPDLASGTLLASIGLGILGDDARLDATGSRPVVRSNAVLARGSRTRNATRYPVTIARVRIARNRPGRSPGKIARADPRVRGSENFNVQARHRCAVHDPRIDARDSRAVRPRDRPPARGRHI